MDQPIELLTLTVMPARWQQHSGPCLVRICEIRGLQSSYSAYPHALVDASIAPLVAMLNTNGYPTLYCCSGVLADHRTSCYSGYISFARQIPESIEAMLPAAAYVDHRDNRYVIRLKPDTDETTRLAAWQAIEQVFAAHFAHL